MKEEPLPQNRQVQMISSRWQITIYLIRDIKTVDAPLCVFDEKYQ